MKTDITQLRTEKLNKISKDYPNGHIETIVGRVYWVWDNQEMKGGTATMAGLTKQHFKAIAEIVKGHTDKGKNGFVWKWDNPLTFLKSLADYFASQNPLFNKNQFIKACLE